MLTILTYFGYSLLGFGVGGLAFKSIDKKAIMEEFRKFKKVKNNEILQFNGNSQASTVKVQELTKDKTELQKLYNRSIRNLELKDIQIADIQQEIEKMMLQNKLDKKPGKESFDDFLNNK